MIRFSKVGHLYKVDPHAHPKLLSHAANPLPVRLDGSVYRVFFSARDFENRSSVGAVDIDLAEGEIVRRHSNVFFEHGPSNSFYSHGVSIGNCYSVGNQTYMLFMGWRNDVDEHWYGQIGRLIVGDDLDLKLDSSEPFLPLDEHDSISMSYPWVLFYKGKYRMWYGSTISWDAGNGEMLHVIKYAESEDGHTWQKFGQVIPSQLGVAQAFSRPTVKIDSSGQFHMWFSYRSGTGESYRIGYCSSANGLEWDATKLALNVSSEGWDSEMLEYPFVLEHEGAALMLYNGNNYGLSGFGMAREIK